MSKKAFDKIAAGLREALAIARGEAKPGRLYGPADITVGRSDTPDTLSGHLRDYRPKPCATAAREGTGRSSKRG
jgi:hypothetical protein